MALATFDDGTGPTLYAGGDFTIASGAPASKLVRWNGSAWEPLPQQPDGNVLALLTWDDGTGPALYVGGEFSAIGSTPASRLAKFDGTSWTSLSSSTTGNVFDLEVFDDGSGEKLYIGGSFSYIGGQYRPGITSWNGSSYSFVPGVQGPSGQRFVFALEPYDDGSGPALYAGGTFAFAGGVVVNGLGRWDGVTWSAVGGWNAPDVRALRAHTTSAGSILVVGGKFQASALIPSTNVVAWNGTTFLALGAGLDDPTGGGGTGSGVEALVSQDFGDGSGPLLFAGGTFTSSGGVEVGTFARWNGSTWDRVGDGTSDEGVFALHARVDPAGARIFAGGRFYAAGTSWAGGAAVFDGTTLHPLEVGRSVADGPVYAMTAFDDGSGEALYVAGWFQGAGTAHARSIARYSGATWSRLGDGANDAVYAVAGFDAGDGPMIYAGGKFSQIGGVATYGIARWNGSAWEALPSSTGFHIVSGSVYAIAGFDDGSGPALFVGGYFLTSEGVYRGSMRWKSGTWLPAGDAGYPVPFIRAFEVFDDGTGAALYRGGSGGPGPVTRWTGTAWTPVGTWIGVGWSTVLALTSFDDGSGIGLIAGGEFSYTTGSPWPGNVAQWKNGAWSPLGSGLLSEVSALAVHDDGTGRGPALIAGHPYGNTGAPVTGWLERWDGTAWSQFGMHSYGSLLLPSIQSLISWNDGSSRDLFVGGLFPGMDAVTSINFARLRGCGETGETFCYGDGSGAACPCGNASAAGDRAGCLHSLGTGGTVRASGEPRLSDDTLVMHGASMPNSAVLYFQGMGAFANGAGAAFGDGLRCLTGPIIRMATKINAGGASTYPTGIDVALSVRGAVFTPGRRTYQARFRNPAAFCTSETFNYTNALELLWVP